MKPEKEITDEQLDQWLKDIPIPNQLHADLRQIPTQNWNPSTDPGETIFLNEQAKTGKTRRSRSLLATFTWLTLAASILFATIIATNYIPSQAPQQQAASPTKDPNDPTAESIAQAQPLIEATKAPEFQALQTQLAEVESMMQQMEINRLQTQLTELNDRSSLYLSMPSSMPLSTNEVNSMVIALAEQSAISYGGSTQKVTEKMNRVIAQFPNSRGAKIANDFLAQNPVN